MITPNSNITIMICNNVISNPIRKPNRLCGEELGGGGEGILPWDYSTLFKGHSLFQRGHLSRGKNQPCFVEEIMYVFQIPVSTAVNCQSWNWFWICFYYNILSHQDSRQGEKIPSPIHVWQSSSFHYSFAATGGWSSCPLEAGVPKVFRKF